MQKKIVAAICAAALALAMPAAAFAKTFDTVKYSGPADSIATITADDDIDGENAKLTNLVVTGKASYVSGAYADATSATASNYVAYTNDVMKQSFELEAGKYRDGDWNGNIDKATFTIAFKQKKIDLLPTTIDQNNLYTRAYVEHADGGVQTFGPVKAKSINIEMNRMSTITAVLGNGPLSYGQPVGANTTADLEASANNGKSPKTGELA